MSVKRLSLVVIGMMFYLVASSNTVWGQSECVTKEQQEKMLVEYCEIMNEETVPWSGPWRVGIVQEADEIVPPTHPSLIPSGGYYWTQISDGECQFYVLTDCQGKIIFKTDWDCWSGW